MDRKGFGGKLIFINKKFIKFRLNYRHQKARPPPHFASPPLPPPWFIRIPLCCTIFLHWVHRRLFKIYCFQAYFRVPGVSSKRAKLWGPEKVDLGLYGKHFISTEGWFLLLRECGRLYRGLYLFLWESAGGSRLSWNQGQRAGKKSEKFFTSNVNSRFEGSSFIKVARMASVAISFIFG